jgi:uncharacterized ferritin-like protein (DUF455 family)
MAELRDFAERVLFAETLEEKLSAPAEITDERPGTALLAPATPGRTRQLRFKSPSAGKSDIPALHRLEAAQQRGRWLHFFANHELLATELMALVLLRFPEAPPAFRRGVLQTLKDEQQHTRLYLQRLGECGIEFGQFPVSGYFWKMLAGMQTPLDYVSGLSLTFEQANLDFAADFARRFAAVGDQESARLLDRIYHDEIGHVAYGLKWFRRWKDPHQSDWEAFCRQLRFPLSPSRAKGMVLNAAGRRAAGFDPAYIAELEVYSQSKGRTPGVFLFNPLAEGYIARGKSFTPDKQQAQLARDLENLPQFFCREDDVVLVEKRPSVEFLRSLKQAGFDLPEFIERNQLARLSGRKLGRLRPWAWGPDSLEILRPLLPQLTTEKNWTPEKCFNEGIAGLYSKAWSAAFLRKWLGTRKATLPWPWLCATSETGVAVRTLPEALSAIGAIRARGHHQVVVKEAIGLAGRNALRLWEPQLLAAQRRWMQGILDSGRTLVIEPWLERQVDFSVQLEMSERGLQLCGYAGLISDHRGQFRGNWATSHYQRRLPAEVVEPFAGTPDFEGQVRRLYAELLPLLEDELRQVNYRGPLGIDAFVYRDRGGSFRLKPIVEINPRYTMGRLTLELMKQVCPGSRGTFRLVTRAEVKRTIYKDFAGFAAGLASGFPLVLEGEPVPKIRRGTLCLNEPTPAQSCLAIFEVTRSVSSSRGQEALHESQI